MEEQTHAYVVRLQYEGQIVFMGFTAENRQSPSLRIKESLLNFLTCLRGVKKQQLYQWRIQNLGLTETQY
jgi:hypothetical protein